MAGIASSLDVRSVAVLSDAEIDAFSRRIAEILIRRTTPEAFDALVVQMEGLLERAKNKISPGDIEL